MGNTNMFLANVKEFKSSTTLTGMAVGRGSMKILKFYYEFMKRLTKKIDLSSCMIKNRLTYISLK
jgi:hypothetical protein